MTLSTGNNCIVIAHPDDEVLWSSSLPIRFKESDWTIICCSVPRHDPIRAWKFFDACHELKATPRLIPATESPPDQNLGKLELLDLSRFDCIVTHNDEGEYGHIHHRNVHDHIVSQYGNKKIYTFGYRKSRLGNIEIELTHIEARVKMAALTKYDHIHPYNGKNIPKWEALIHRYRDVEGINLFKETFDEYQKP